LRCLQAGYEAGIQRPSPQVVLGISVAAVSTAAILVRLAPTVPPVALAFWRTFLAGAILLPFWGVARLRPAPKLSVREGLLTLFAGTLLAAHFFAWFTSLHHTSVLRSTTLVCLTPIWAGVFETIFLRSPPKKVFWMGVSVSLVGVFTLTGGQMDGSLYGDLLAVLGGLLAAGYMVTGRSVRPRIAIGPYGAAVFGCSGLCLLIASGGSAAAVGELSMSDWSVIIAMTIGPQILGHLGLNHCLRDLSAATVSTVVLLEPVGATILAFFLFEESPRSSEILGSILILMGVVLATRDKSQSTTPTQRSNPPSPQASDDP